METNLRALLDRDTKSVSMNPFGVTKSDDFSNEEINRFWIEPGGVPASHLLKPTRLMPMQVIGGKGSGKTHLLRHFSYAAQTMARQDGGLASIATQGYLGVYVRCDGLNAARFAGKSQQDDTWLAVFQYFLDLWLAQALLTQLSIGTHGAGDPNRELLNTDVPTAICELFDEPPATVPASLVGLMDLLRNYQREIDIAINNLPITRTLDVRIRTGPSRLIFGVPQAVNRCLPQLKDTVFLYLLDEMENLSISQQKYLNTLIRHRTGRCSFRLGARLYGIKTNDTLDGETNRPGAEFDVLELDAYWRSRKQYNDFCERLCIRRLQAVGYFNDQSDEMALKRALASSLDEPSPSRFYQSYTLSLVTKYEPNERPYFKRLNQELMQHARADRKLGVATPLDADAVIATLSVPEYPLLEKMNLYLFYKDWAQRADLKRAAKRIKKECQEFIATGGNRPAEYSVAYGHFASDMLAQLTRETGYRVKYVGLQTFISMSSGLPRNLLIILKNVFDWAVFHGENPFSAVPIKMETQERAVLDSCSWFFEEARPKQDADHVQRGVERLATLFRGIRYSDKPSECSLSTFSCPVAGLSQRTQEILSLAQDWSMLIKHRRGQKDRNSERVDQKYQLR